MFGSVSASAETAINIGYSCKLLTEEMEDVFIIDAETYDDVFRQLSDARNTMSKALGSPMQSVGTLGVVDGVGVTFGGVGVGGGGREPSAIEAKLSANDVEFGGFAIVINGHSLVSGEPCEFIYVFSCKHMPVIVWFDLINCIGLML